MANKVKVSEQNFMAYLERLTAAVGHADRHEPLRVYLEGLLLPGERKSVEPMAARIDPRNVRSPHQSMHHFVATAPWDAQEIMEGGARLCARGVRVPRRRRGLDPRRHRVPKEGNAFGRVDGSTAASSENKTTARSP